MNQKQQRCMIKVFSLVLPYTANNEGIEALDLSWNHIRMKGAVAFCAGLKVRLSRKLN